MQSAGHSLGQVLVELGLADFSDFVGDVAGIAAHVESGVAAAFLGDIQPWLWQSRQRFCPFLTARCLEQLILVVGLVRIVALDAIAYRRRMHGPFQRRGIFIGVTTEAERLRRRSDELDASDVFIDPYLMAAQASHRDRGMYGFAFALIFMTFQAFGRICFWLQRDRMHCSEKLCSAQQGHEQNKHDSQRQPLHR